VTTSEGRRAAALYRRGTDQPGSAEPLVRASYLEVVSRCAEADDFADAFAKAFPDRPWRTRWARWRPTSDHRLVVTGHTSWVHDFAAGALPDGTRILATAGADGAVRVWELESCRPYGQPLGVDRLRADAVTLGVGADGSPLLVAGFQGAIQVWDLTSGETCWPRSRSWVAPRAVRLGRLRDGTAVVVSSHAEGTDAGMLRLWDLRSGDPIDELEHASPLRAMTVYDGTAGTTVLSADHHEVYVRDADSGEGYRLPLPDVRALAATAVGDSAVAVAGFARPHHIQAWDLESGEPFGPSIPVSDGGTPSKASRRSPRPRDARLSLRASSTWSRPGTSTPARPSSPGSGATPGGSRGSPPFAETTAGSSR
jgi:WD40 repeat protein